MVLIDMVDSYRALPKKLRLFYRHLAIHVNYDYVLKIDDDTWTNIPRALEVPPGDTYLTPDPGLDWRPSKTITCHWKARGMGTCGAIGHGMRTGNGPN